MMDKILYVGHGKTGTSGFGTACEVLGYRLFENSAKLTKAWNNKEYNIIWEVADKYDVLEDYPWLYTYKKFDKRYPNTKFVLGIRDSDRWVKSIIYQSIRSHILDRRRDSSKTYFLEYGFKYPACHEKELKEMFNKHNEEVREYFQDRPNDLLEVCWENGDGWNKICKFLDKPIPDLPFPMRKNAYPYPNYEMLKKEAMNNPEEFYGW